MCDEISPAGASAGANLSVLADWVTANAIPIGIAVAADVALAFVVTHLILVIMSTTVVLLTVTVGRVALARLLLRVMGRVACPVLPPGVGPKPKVKRTRVAPVPALPRAMQRSIQGRPALSAPKRASAAPAIQSPAAPPVRQQAAITARSSDVLDVLEGVVMDAWQEEMVRR